MADIFEIAGRIHSTSQEGVVAPANEILDTEKNKKQSQINAEVDATLNTKVDKVEGKALSTNDYSDEEKNKVSSLEDAIGTGGSVDSRIATAKSEIIGDATTDYNTLGKVESKLAPIEEIVDDCAYIGENDGSAVIADFDPQSDTVWKKEQILSAAEKAQVQQNIGVKEWLNTLTGEKFASYTATDQTTAVTQVLPATGATDTVYRVGMWDGSAYNQEYYSDYAWDGTVYVQLNKKSIVGEVFDISEYHGDAKYADLTVALDGGNNVPQSVRKGGMSIKFVCSSDNKYVQYRLMSATFSTATYDWQNIGEFYPEVNYICDANDYNWIPCNLPAGEWKITLYNASPNNNVTAAFKDANGNQFYYTDEVPPQQTRQFIVDLETDAASVATAFVGSKLVIEKVSYSDKVISALQDDVSELQGEFTETLITVDINGTIGVDCDYNNIQNALDSITDNTKQKRYVVFVKNGIYDITGISYLGLKNYVTVRGETRDGVIIYNSSVSYSAATVCFDPAKYGSNIIDYARIENLTMKIKNGKCCTHIDGQSIKNGGTIEIDSCRLINETEQQYLYYLRGGINCGLNGGQNVKVTNCFGNVLCYAHTRVNPQQVSSPNSFIFENCQFNFIAFYDISDRVVSGLRNKLIVKDCKCDYIGIGVADAANDKSQCSIDYIIDNNTQFNWVYIFGQGYVDGYDNWFTKYPICSSIHQVVKNDTGSTISKGTFVSLNINGGIPASDNLQPQYDYDIVPYNGNELYGITLEDIPSGDIGIVQISGKVLIPNNNYSVGDYITLNENGEPVIGTKGNAVGVITNPDQPHIGGSLMRLLNRNIVY